MICKAFSFNLPIFLMQKTKKIQCDFLELENLIASYSALLNILNSWDFKRCLILLKAQHESNLKLVPEISTKYHPHLVYSLNS